MVQQHFYKSLGANYTTYRPLEKFNKNQITPTEIDDYFRYDTVHGYVHDMGAAMQDGVGGHAGLFSNANDVAKLMQMYLQEGSTEANVIFHRIHLRRLIPVIIVTKKTDEGLDLINHNSKMKALHVAVCR